MISVKYKIEGTCPILFHNIDSMDLIKPKKITHQDWEASEEVLKSRLYIRDGELVLPEKLVFGLLKSSAQKSGIKQDGKRSTYASIIRAVVFCLEPIILEQKYEDIQKHREYVTVQRSKILRVFPMLKQWSGVLKLNFDDSQISEEVIDELIKFAGDFVGFGDYRPTFGRFKVKKV